jgi:hypothetical protein
MFLLASVVNVVRKMNSQQSRGNPHEKVVFLFGAGIAQWYTFIITIALSPFRCKLQIDGSYTLTASPSLDCYDYQWMKNWPIICIGLSYILLIPAYFFFILWKNRNNLTDPHFIRRYGYLILGIKPKLYWWNVFQLLRKTFLVMMIDLSNSLDSMMRVFLVLVALLAGMFFESLVQPRKDQNASSQTYVLL